MSSATKKTKSTSKKQKEKTNTNENENEMDVSTDTPAPPSEKNGEGEKEQFPNPKKIKLTKEESKKLLELKENKAEFQKYYDLLVEEKKKTASEYTTFKLTGMQKVVGRKDVINLVSSMELPADKRLIPLEGLEGKKGGGGKKKAIQKAPKINQHAQSALMFLNMEVLEKVAEGVSQITMANGRKTIFVEDVVAYLSIHFPPEQAEKIIQEMKGYYENYMESVRLAGENVDESSSSSDEDESDEEDITLNQPIPADE